ncbi:hypothetical protein NP569_24790, partial [Vibrio parahaemolyticus]|nr:hypothetical protein [Vibrio parahaemolyticus]
PRAFGGLADMAVYESGVAALTPEANGHGDLEERTGLESADLYVFDVAEGSAEWNADMRPGDRIVEVDQAAVSSWATFLERLLVVPDRRKLV